MSVTVPSNRGGGTRTPSSRRGTAYGSKRGTPDKQNARKRNREQSHRVRDSLEEIRAAQAELDARIKLEAESPALGPTVGAQFAAEQRELDARTERLAGVKPEKQRDEMRELHPLYAPWDGDPREPFSIGCARQMIRSGYTVQYVMKLTGIGYRWLDDMPIGADHRITA